MTKFNDVDWSELGYPDMGDILEGLASADENIRERAYDGLFDNYLFELQAVCLYLVPRFITLLQDTSVRGKDRLMMYLRRWVGNIYETRGKGFGDEELTVILAEIKKGKEVYERLKLSDDNDYRAIAKDLLHNLREL